jgi:protein-disulfide isomerase
MLMVTLSLMLSALWYAACLPNATSAAGASAPAIDRLAQSPLLRIPEHGSVLGDANAPVTLVVFGDMQCPACNPFFLEVLPRLLGRWVQTGKVRVEYRSLETATVNRHEFLEEAIAAAAAGAQGAEWLFVEGFLRAQGEEGTDYATEAFLDRLAKNVPGLDVAKWKGDRKNPRYKRQVMADERVANRYRIGGTPSFLLGRSGRTLRRFEPEPMTARTFGKGFEAVLRRR